MNRLLFVREPVLQTTASGLNSDVDPIPIDPQFLNLADNEPTTLNSERATHYPAEIAYDSPVPGISSHTTVSESHSSLKQATHSMQNATQRLEQLTLNLAMGQHTKTEVVAGSGWQAFTALSFLYPHLRQLVSTHCIKSPMIAPLGVLAAELKEILADTSRLSTSEIEYGAIKPTPNHLRRPNQPLVVQWHLLKSRQRSTQAASNRDHTKKRKSPYTEEIKYSFRLPIGQVLIHLSIGPFKSGYRGTGPQSLGARLYFFPYPQLMIQGVIASYGYGLPRMVSSFGVHSNDSPIVQALESRNLFEVQRLFSAQLARPNDRDEDGESLLWVCISHFTLQRLILIAPSTL
jgi:hypothetical protein